MAEAATVAVERAELVTQDMGMLAALVGQLYAGHAPRFRCPDPARVDGAVRSAAAGQLGAALFRYRGFVYESPAFDPVADPIATSVTHGSGCTSSLLGQVRFTRGDVYMVPAGQPLRTFLDDAEHSIVQVPWPALTALAEEHAGVGAHDLRFEAMTPLSAARQRALAATVEFACGQLVSCGASRLSSLVVQEMTSLAAAAMLGTFPNTTMTAGYVPGPGWVPPVAVHRAVTYITEHASRPVTVPEIAAAAGVSTRALREAFARYFQVTPAGFLRRVRLEHAYDELAVADPASGLTVAAVSRRWGWLTPARFSAAYQQRFGVPPGRTLRT